MDGAIIVLIITIGIILGFAITGAVKGFVKMAVSLLSLILTVVLVWVVNPYVSDFIKNNTPLYTSIDEKCQEYMRLELAQKMTREENKTSGAQFDGEEGEKKLDNSWLNIVNDVVDATVIQAEEAMAGSIEELAKSLGARLADVILTIITFVITFILITLVLKLIFGALNIITRLPVIHTLNRTAGGILGAAFGIAVVWIAMLIAIVLFNTTVGVYVLKSVEDNGFMKILYDLNPLIMIFIR